jgi:hypothetical protein
MMPVTPVAEIPVMRYCPDPFGVVSKIPEPLKPPALPLTAKLKVSAWAARQEVAHTAATARRHERIRVMDRSLSVKTSSVWVWVEKSKRLQRAQL